MGQMLTFPAGSQVLPVQTSLPQSHLLVTGDVLTITPRIPGARPSRQVCVRYAATDGFHLSGTRPVDPDNNTWDTVNRYFAFTEPLRPKDTTRWDDGTFELVAWPGWSGNDLTHGGPNVASNVRMPYVAMPLVAAFGAGAQLYLGGEDTTKPFRQGGATTQGQMVIDGLWAGVQPGGNGYPSTPDNLVHRFGSSPTSLRDVYDRNQPEKRIPWLTTAPLGGTAVYLRSTNPVFHRDLGLVLIGGEVFAYERQHNVPPGEVHHVVRLIGRGLLGSKPVAHRGPEPILVLPIGPVTRLVQPLNQGGATEQELFISPDTGKGNRHYVMHAPAHLFCSPDGQKMELIAAPHRCVATWHRGLYNTVPLGTWTGTASGANPQQDTLVIGWWPRYPSGTPNPQSPGWTGLSNDHKSALLRCRMYAWMGFPIRFHDTYLNGSGLLDLELIDDGVGTFNVLASALDQGFDWTEANQNSVPLRVGGGMMDASAVFTRYQRKPVDGVEVRVRWEYRQPAADVQQLGSGPNANGAAVFLDRVATAGNTAPMIGKVRLRARAPAKILQVEDAR
jgi:hypothetical protein